MKNYRTTAHTLYDIKCHIVWITKYRKPVLHSKIAGRVRDMIKEICKANDVEIMTGHVSKDHVHLFVSIPPYISVSKLMQLIKGKTSRKLLMEFKELNKKFWGRHMGKRIFCSKFRKCNR